MGTDKEPLISELADKILEMFKDYGKKRHTTVEIDIAAMLVVLNKMYSYVMLRRPDNTEYNIMEPYNMKNSFDAILDKFIKDTIQKGNSSKAEAERLR